MTSTVNRVTWFFCWRSAHIYHLSSTVLIVLFIVHNGGMSIPAARVVLDETSPFHRRRSLYGRDDQCRPTSWSGMAKHVFAIPLWKASSYYNTDRLGQWHDSITVCSRLCQVNNDNSWPCCDYEQCCQCTTPVLKYSHCAFCYDVTWRHYHLILAF